MKKNSVIIFLLSLSFTSCAQIKIQNRPAQTGPDSTLQAKDGKVEAKDIQISNGQALRLVHPLAKGIERPTLTCNNKEVPYKIEKQKLVFFISEPYKSQLKPYACFLDYTLSSGRGERLKIFNIAVNDYPYKVEQLSVAKRHVQLSKKDLARWLKERKRLKKMYQNTISRPLFDSPFEKPLNSYITSVYGGRRVFNNKKDSWHSGVDFRAPIGTPVPAANDGRVALVYDLFFNGKAVFIDHGLGIMTMYCHLSKFNVKEGDYIKKGDIIALSGNTGRSTGPHLHWGTRVHGHWINGLSLIDEQINKTAQTATNTPY